MDGRMAARGSRKSPRYLQRGNVRRCVDAGYVPYLGLHCTARAANPLSKKQHDDDKRQWIAGGWDWLVSWGGYKAIPIQSSGGGQKQGTRRKKHENSMRRSITRKSLPPPPGKDLGLGRDWVP